MGKALGHGEALETWVGQNMEWRASTDRHAGTMATTVETNMATKKNMPRRVWDGVA